MARKEDIAQILCQFCGDLFDAPIKQVDMDHLDDIQEKLRFAHLCPWALDELSSRPRVAEIGEMVAAAINNEDYGRLASHLLRLERRIGALEKPKP